MTKQKKEYRIYNVLFPIWMLIFIPSPLWLLIIPGNYIIDRLVLYLSLKNYPERNAFCKQSTWKICLAGFGADFIGALFLFFLMTLETMFPEESAIAKALYGVSENPFSNVGSFIFVALAIIISGIIIYSLDKYILKKNGLEDSQAKKSALWMAIATAPYLFLIPTTLLYD